ncbi:unnamed protein product [Callosobruchus maculatus]|uniref:CCHC-type domain-containing protein n=1 Tax=Callosobruchus maculatus TaxID=64391 RepID=A0A653C2P2_CALMS|nr:unnamed protein product [Callosobruchus maculatus]
MAPDVDVCKKCADNFVVSSKFVQCKVCNVKLHTSCASLKDSWQKVLTDCKNIFWMCDPCKNSFSVGGNENRAAVEILKKEIECVNREKTLTDKLLSEVQYTNELQKALLKQLEDKIASLENTKHLKYNEAVKSATQMSVKKRESTPVLLVKSKNDRTSNDDVMKDVIQSINPADLNVCISATRKIKNGIAIHCETKSFDVLKSNLSASLGKKYSINEPQKLNPRFLISDVPSKCGDSPEVLVNNIVLLNDLANVLKSEDDIKFITKLNRLQDTDVVIEVAPYLYNLLMQRGFLYVGWKKCYITDYVRVKRCFKCCGLGHLDKDCTAQVCCPKCCGDHKLKECKSDCIKCSNCTNYNKSFKQNVPTDHKATSFDCPLYKNYLDKLKQNINYG